MTQKRSGINASLSGVEISGTEHTLAVTAWNQTEIYLGRWEPDHHHWNGVAMDTGDAIVLTFGRSGVVTDITGSFKGQVLQYHEASNHYANVMEAQAGWWYVKHR